MGEAALRFLIGLGERIQAADILVFRWINLGWAHPTLDTAMGLTTQLGLGWVQLALLALLYTFGGPTGRRTALLCMLAFAVSGLIAQILKEGCERVRPGLVVADYRFLGEQVLYGSFPSGHTTTSLRPCPGGGGCLPAVGGVALPGGRPRGAFPRLRGRALPYRRAGRHRDRPLHRPGQPERSSGQAGAKAQRVAPKNYPAPRNKPAEGRPVSDAPRQPGCPAPTWALPTGAKVPGGGACYSLGIAPCLPAVPGCCGRLVGPGAGRFPLEGVFRGVRRRRRCPGRWRPGARTARIAVGRWGVLAAGGWGAVSAPALFDDPLALANLRSRIRARPGRWRRDVRRRVGGVARLIAWTHRLRAARRQ